MAHAQGAVLTVENMAACDLGHTAGRGRSISSIFGLERRPVRISPLRRSGPMLNQEQDRVLIRDRRDDGAISRSLPVVDVQLDPVTWKVLQDIAAQQGRSLRDLISDIARDVLSDAIRFYVTEFCRLAVAQH